MIAPITKYFKLTEKQQEQFARLDGIYKEWNEKINVISRKDIDELYLKHVLHALGIAKIIRFTPKTRIIDVGTGGGFPGVPLAILFPDSDFLLIDSIGKKIKVVEAVIEALELKNATAQQIRSNELRNQKFDFIVSRAVTSLPKFVADTRHLIAKKDSNPLPNGILYLKGGNLNAELHSFSPKQYAVDELSSFFDEPFFETKKVIYLQI